MSSEGYTFLPDVAIADVAFRAWAPTLEAVFRQAALATLEVMVDDVSTVRARERREVDLTARNEELLLLDFLGELIFHKDAEALLLAPERLAIEPQREGWRLSGVLAGEPIDPERHPLDADVKAVTLHRFRLERTDEGWEAEAVLDV